MIFQMLLSVNYQCLNKLDLSFSDKHILHTEFDHSTTRWPFKNYRVPCILKFKLVILISLKEDKLKKWESTYEHGSKCIDCVLTTEGILLKTKGIELIECSEIIESDHQGCLTYVDFSNYFADTFFRAAVFFNNTSERILVSDKSIELIVKRKQPHVN